MRTLSCDVLVVGAGPAGSSAAKAAVEQGASVIVAERRESIGEPVRCAEYIPAMLVRNLATESDFIVQRVEGLRSYLHGKQIQEMYAPGYIIKRDSFDKALAFVAFDRGVQFYTGYAAVSKFEDGTVLLMAKDGRELRIEARVIIGADGPLSKVASWMGLKKNKCIPSIQTTLSLRSPLNYTYVFFDESIPAGYAWIFPKGKMANVGLGMMREGGSLVRALRSFVEAHKDFFILSGEVRPHTGGWIPVSVSSKSVEKNMILVGDAAGHTHPITGAGVFQAVLGGKMAGKWAAKAVQENNLDLLWQYKEEWDEFYGDTLAHAYSRRKEWESYKGSLDGRIRRFWIGFKEYYA